MKKAIVYNGKTLQVVEYDINSYDFLHKSVGGYIEHIPVNSLEREHIDLWCNDEGKLLGLDPTLMLSYEGDVYDLVVGNIVFTRFNKEGKTLSLTDKNIEYIKKLFDGLGTTVFGGRKFPVLPID